MAKKYKDEEEEEEEEEEEDFDEDFEEPELKKVENEKKPLPSSKKKAGESITYSAYRLPERAGIKNDKTNESIGEDVLTILASIKTDIQELKDGLL